MREEKADRAFLFIRKKIRKTKQKSSFGKNKNVFTRTPIDSSSDFPIRMSSERTDTEVAGESNAPIKIKTEDMEWKSSLELNSGQFEAFDRRVENIKRKLAERKAEIGHKCDAMRESFESINWNWRFNHSSQTEEKLNEKSEVEKRLVINDCLANELYDEGVDTATNIVIANELREFEKQVENREKWQSK